MIRNIVYFLLSVIVFFAGVLAYGAVLNSREISLSEAMKQKGVKNLENVSLIVHRSSYTLDLYSGSQYIKSYKAVFGMSSKSRRLGSRLKSTPVGIYTICDKIPNYYFGKMLKLNFPNMQDAVSALRSGTIGLSEFNKIQTALEINQCPPVEGSDNEIGIHGTGKLNFILKNLPFSYNWTGGSIALSDENIDEIYSIINIGDKVVIKN